MIVVLLKYINQVKKKMKSFVTSNKRVAVGSAPLLVTPRNGANDRTPPASKKILSTGRP